MHQYDTYLDSPSQYHPEPCPYRVYLDRLPPDDSSGYTATTSNSHPDTNDGNDIRDYSGIGLGWNMEFNFTGGST
jgi:hypothetical protein